MATVAQFENPAKSTVYCICCGRGRISCSQVLLRTSATPTDCVGNRSFLPSQYFAKNRTVSSIGPIGELGHVLKSYLHERIQVQDVTHHMIRMDTVAGIALNLC